MTEIWVPIPEWPSYEVSDQGRVRSVDRISVNARGRVVRYRGKLLSPTTDAYGRKRVQLSSGARPQTQIVPRLVLSAFVGPGGELHALHNDGNPSDDRLENLRWGTRSENMRDVIRHGRHANAGKGRCKNGHEFTEANTYVTTRGTRSCRRCTADAQQRYRRRLVRES